MNITTTYKTNGAGKGQIVAKGNGKQRTVTYDHSLSASKNHGDAAGTLALVLGYKDPTKTQCVEAHNGRCVFKVWL